MIFVLSRLEHFLLPAAAHSDARKEAKSTKLIHKSIKTVQIGTALIHVIFLYSLESRKRLANNFLRVLLLERALELVKILLAIISILQGVLHVNIRALTLR